MKDHTYRSLSLADHIVITDYLTIGTQNITGLHGCIRKLYVLIT